LFKAFFLSQNSRQQDGLDIMRGLDLCGPTDLPPGYNDIRLVWKMLDQENVKRSVRVRTSPPVPPPAGFEQHSIDKIAEIL